MSSHLTCLRPLSFLCREQAEKDEGRELAKATRPCRRVCLRHRVCPKVAREVSQPRSLARICAGLPRCASSLRSAPARSHPLACLDRCSARHPCWIHSDTFSENQKRDYSDQRLSCTMRGLVTGHRLLIDALDANNQRMAKVIEQGFGHAVHSVMELLRVGIHPLSQQGATAF